jgi:hypothetical protein
MSAAVSTGLALKCEVVCQGYLYARNVAHLRKAHFGGFLTAFTPEMGEDGPMKWLVWAIALAGFTCTPATSSEWHASFGEDSDGPICYLSVFADGAAKTSVPRDEPIISLAIRSFQPISSEFSVMLQAYRNFSRDGLLLIDGKGFEITIRGSNGWLTYSQDEKAVFNALRSAKSASVYFSENGRELTDVYFPRNFNEALNKLREICRLRT